jgi:hypothetical protein
MAPGGRRAPGLLPAVNGRANLLARCLLSRSCWGLMASRSGCRSACPGRSRVGVWSAGTGCCARSPLFPTMLRCSWSWRGRDTARPPPWVSRGQHRPVRPRRGRRVGPVRHFDAIIAAVELGLSNSRLEGINAKIRLIQRRGYGFRNLDALSAAIYLCLGGISLNLPTER